ncbi:MAG: ParB N-terminal domain-containing protein [Candidatus Heimdallarchaeota archaeon]|nr:ParB N-terminal domain-containing protein [Candidatus Heimdallarchaeota archaeon]
MNETNYKFHEAANIFPMMAYEEYQGLKKDISENGLLDPIILFEKKILDGRNRYKACEELGLEIKTISLNGDTEPIGFVLSKNLHRRHLTTAQKAEIALLILERKTFEGKEKREQNLKQNQVDSVFVTESKDSYIETSKQLGISTTTITQMKKIKEEISNGNNKVKEAFEKAKNKEVSFKSVVNLVENKERKELREKQEQRKEQVINEKLIEKNVVVINRESLINVLEKYPDGCFAVARDEQIYFQADRLISKCETEKFDSQGFRFFIPSKLAKILSRFDCELITIKKINNKIHFIADRDSLSFVAANESTGEIDSSVLTDDFDIKLNWKQSTELLDFLKKFKRYGTKISFKLNDSKLIVSGIFEGCTGTSIELGFGDD